MENRERENRVKDILFLDMTTNTLLITIDVFCWIHIKKHPMKNSVYL